MSADGAPRQRHLPRAPARVAVAGPRGGGRDRRRPRGGARLPGRAHGRAESRAAHFGAREHARALLRQPGATEVGIATVKYTYFTSLFPKIKRVGRS